MKNQSLARRYAKALIAIGSEHKNFDALNTELNAIAAIFESHEDLTSVLCNPSYNIEKRRTILVEVLNKLNPSKTLHNLMMLLFDRDRSELIIEIAEQYQIMADEKAGRVRAEVIAASQSDLDEIEKLKVVLEKKLDKKVVLSTAIDENLVAGKITRIGSSVYDGSVRTRLENLRTELLAGKI